MIRQSILNRKYLLIYIFFLATLCSLWGAETGGYNHTVHAQSNITRANAIMASLPSPSDKHYFGLAPAVRDSGVVVTLAFEPRTDLSLSGLINFAVLTEDGLRRYLAGTPIAQASIASGARVSYDRVGNKLQAAFQDSGRGQYTVIVYNNSSKAVSYTLAVEGGDLIDELGQIESAPGLQTALPLAADTQSNANVNSPSSTQPAAGTEPSLYPEIRALRVTSSLDPTLDRHYLTVEPETSDSIVSLNMKYGPLNEPALNNNVSFYVLNEDGFRRLVHGDRPEDVNIAVGFPSPYADKPNELLAGFQAGGRGPYTVVISNRAALAVSYQMNTSQAVLIDHYGQTNEAQAAVAEYAAIQNAAENPNAGVTTASTIRVSEPIQDDERLIRTSSSANTLANQRTVEIQNQFNLPYQHHYYGLEPTISNSQVQITLAYALTSEELSVNPPNFWVLDEDGLRRVMSGARPMDVNIANGAIVPDGADQGKLRATFKASGKGPYTIVIDNNANSSAEYYVRVSGGFLMQAPADSELLLVLP